MLSTLTVAINARLPAFPDLDVPTCDQHARDPQGFQKWVVLWDWVIQESGLGSGVGSAVKLVFVKYLDRLDRRLQEIVKDKGSNGSLLESGTNLSGALMELVSQFIGAFPSGFSHLDSHKNELDVTQNVSNGNGNMISDASIEEVPDRKRKLERHRKMLKWVVEVAKNPYNPEVGSLPDRCKWKCYGPTSYGSRFCWPGKQFF
ncbi:hypothetical protein Vadar_003405 [Vaccinium darrowii]|uniref:Uncharacterized protein n=1 Tax=Vaccinium darrowii TaxID=229202 RepID=A0ACB7YT26_9ERIC|nr:hypothetical protein Vadar_003405 [Vaccinium darrowii]